MTSYFDTNKQWYDLRYKNQVVLQFCPTTLELYVRDKYMLPISIMEQQGYNMILRYCTERMLLLNRKYCKEILTSCCIENQTAINICIVSKALSFRDCYWICKTNSDEKWENVNLYKNKFSNQIAYVALTGKSRSVLIGDKIFTGELTSKGSRAKCFVRTPQGVFLIKHETTREVFAEILSYFIAKALDIQSSRYAGGVVLEKYCSICQITTSEDLSMLPYADYMARYDENVMSLDTKSYSEFMRVDPSGFLKMHIFDYITLNTDRNRDNFGLMRDSSGKLSMYPLFDHDSCFKGRSVNARYFPTGLTFKDTIQWIRSNHRDWFRSYVPTLQVFYRYVCGDEFRALFFRYMDNVDYEGLLQRTYYLLSC